MARIENDLSERRETREFPPVDQKLIDELYITLQLRYATDEQVYYDQAEAEANKIRYQILALHSLAPSDTKPDGTIVDSEGKYKGFFDFRYELDTFGKTVFVAMTVNINTMQGGTWDYKADLKPSSEGLKKASERIREENSKSSI